MRSARRCTSQTMSRGRGSRSTLRLSGVCRSTFSMTTPGSPRWRWRTGSPSRSCTPSTAYLIAIRLRSIGVTGARRCWWRSAARKRRVLRQASGSPGSCPTRSWSTVGRCVRTRRITCCGSGGWTRSRARTARSRRRAWRDARWCSLRRCRLVRSSTSASSVEPHVDGRRVCYVGEISGRAKQKLYANAAALLMPIRWREPFGMVMIEALACGTPVIAFPEGAASEIVIDGENGMLVADEAEMARAIGEVASIDPLRCRSSVAERYDISVTVTGYERVYRAAIAADSRSRDARRSLPRAARWIDRNDRRGALAAPKDCPWREAAHGLEHSSERGVACRDRSCVADPTCRWRLRRSRPGGSAHAVSAPSRHWPESVAVSESASVAIGLLGDVMLGRMVAEALRRDATRGRVGSRATGVGGVAGSGDLQSRVLHLRPRATDDADRAQAVLLPRPARRRRRPRGR